MPRSRSVSTIAFHRVSIPTARRSDLPSARIINRSTSALMAAPSCATDLFSTSFRFSSSTHLMMRRAPIDSHKPSNFFHRVFSFLKRAAEMRSSLLFTGAHGATSDRTLHPDPSEKAHDPTRRLIRWRTGALFSEWPGLPHRIFVNEASQDVQEGNRRCARAQRRRARKGDRRKVPTRPSTRARAASPVGEGPYPVTFGLITRRVL